jgi:hypothetical protein
VDAKNTSAVRGVGPRKFVLGMEGKVQVSTERSGGPGQRKVFAVLLNRGCTGLLPALPYILWKVEVEALHFQLFCSMDALFLLDFGLYISKTAQAWPHYAIKGV